MTNDHTPSGHGPGAPGPANRAAVAGTVTLKSPTTTDKIYPGSVIEIVVEFTATTGNVPADAYALLKLTGSGAIDYEIRGNPQRPFVGEAGALNKATATFYVHIQTAATGVLRFTVESATPSIVSFTTLISPAFQPDETALSFAFTDSDPLYLKGSSSLVPPFVSPPPHEVARYTVTVTQQVGGAPVPGYLVEWGQAGWDAGVFDPGIVKVYGSNVSGAEQLVVDYLQYDLSKQGVVRSKTNASGVAEIYIVPRNKGSYFSILGNAPINAGRSFLPVTIVGPATGDPPAPYLNLLQNDMDNVQGDFVNVGVSLPLGAAVNDSLVYLLFLNDELVAFEVLNIDKPPVPSNFNIPVGKVSFNSTDDPGGYGVNTVSYSVSSQRIGERTSLPLTVTLSGNKGDNIPDPSVERHLTAPWVNGAGGTVTRNTIANDADCRASTVPNAAYWPSPGAADIVTGTLRANGWDTSTGEPKQPKAIPVTWSPLASTDLSRGYATVTVSRYLLQGYGPEPGVGTPATLYFDGNVLKGGTGDPVYMKVNSYLLQT